MNAEAAWFRYGGTDQKFVLEYLPDVLVLLVWTSHVCRGVLSATDYFEEAYVWTREAVSARKAPKYAGVLGWHGKNIAVEILPKGHPIKGSQHAACWHHDLAMQILCAH